MDTGNGKKTIYTDAIGKPQSKPSNPSDLGSPIELLHPDRYEFYTFDDNGDSDAFDLDAFSPQGFVAEKKVTDVVNNVQNVLKEEMEMLKDPISKPIFDTPDVSDSWSMILPAIFGNSGEDIKPDKPLSQVTPDTIMIEPNGNIQSSTISHTTLSQATTSKPVYYSSQMLTQKLPTSTESMMKVEIFSNSQQSNENTSSHPILMTTEHEIPTRESVEMIYSKPPLIRTTTTVVSNSPEAVTIGVNNNTSDSTISSIQSTTQMITDSTPSDILNKEAVDTDTSLTTTGSSSQSSFPTTMESTPESKATTVQPSVTVNNRSNITLEYIADKILSSSTTTISATTESVTTVSTQNSFSTSLQKNSELSSTPILDISSNETTTETYNVITSTGTILSKPIMTPSTTNIPSLLQSLSNDQKLSASELLDQLLLTTNIYEINTELTSTKDVNSDKYLEIGISDSNVPSKVNIDDIPIATTDRDSSAHFPTTDPIIQSIEELLSQTVNTFSEPNVQNFNAEKVQQIIENSSQKTMEEVIKSAATVGSQLIGQTVMDITTEPELIMTTIEENTSNANSIFTTVPTSDLSLNISTIIAENNSIETTTFTMDNSFNETALMSESSTENKQSLYENIYTERTTSESSEESTIYYIKSKVPNTTTTTTTTESEPHLINITIISYDPSRNVSKPAKSDLSLEQKVIAEEMKNMSMVRNNTSITGNLSETKNVSTNTSSSALINPKIQTSSSVMTAIPSTTTVTPSTTRATPSTIRTTLSTTRGIPSTTRTTPSTTRATTLTTKDILLTTKATPSTTKTTPSTISIPPSTTSATSPTIKEAPSNKPKTTTSKSTSILSTITATPLKTISPSTTITPSIITTTKRIEINKKPIQPSIVITISENNTFVTENGKLMANKTILSSESYDIKSTSTSPSKLASENHTWTLVSTVKPHQDSIKQTIQTSTMSYANAVDPPTPVDLVPKPMQGFGLEESTNNLDNDVYQFIQLCNELAFGFWKTVTAKLSSARSVFVSPFAATSMLAMVFLGAKGATSEEMNEILQLDNMVTFNPHLTFKNVSESIETGLRTGVATSTIIRELFSDRSKGKLLDFYKNRVKAFYDGYVEEVGYKEIGDVIRRRTNLLVKKYTDGKYVEYLKDSSIVVRAPLSGVGVNIFETDCSQSSYDGRDGELHFVVLPSIRQRRLIPIPAVVYRTGFLAGYEPSLDATAVSLGNKDQTVSTILVIPGQQGISAPGDGLARLEKRLVESSFKKGAWSRLLRSLIPRPGLEIQIPRFSHKSVINATSTLKQMGLRELFNPDQADLRGLNGVSNELHLSDVLQINSFATCGERKIGESHHSEIYPAAAHKSRESKYLQHVPMDIEEEPRDYQRAFHDPLHDPSLFALPLSQRPRQARIPEVPRLRFDRPFLYFIRHNPTGLILHMGRFNPRLLP
ncbi:hypothetical protein GWI33_013041 [Rhynchophorus ferrugineus]|uniref:Serpin domain-containing protein n=1 Tax=Rhynchophorus ferrugineus TaxID=354439 RepID=A0A834I5E0_RHYFE|nr:hypothetical protein GWI33_013041 [Rhynchophorus ferrugineus]